MDTNFKLDVLSNKPLSMQLADALKSAIARGVWKVGDVLPGIHELAARCNTSEKIPRNALERLAAEGWTRSKRGVGSVIVDRGVDMRGKGRVLLYIRIKGWSHYFSELIFTLNARLLAAGCNMVLVSGEHGRPQSDGRILAEMLKERWSLVLVCGRSAEVRRLVADSGWPFAIMEMCVPEAPCIHPSCVGNIGVFCNKAIPDFVRACSRRNVKHMVQFGYGNGAFDVTPMLSVADVKVESVNVPPQNTPWAIYRASMAMMRQFLRNRRRTLPDTFLFTDDFVAQGALFVLNVSTLRVPEDVKIVTLANRGCGLVWPIPLSRIEMDPVFHGRAIAKAVVSYVQTGVFPSGVKLGSVWKPGGTF